MMKTKEGENIFKIIPTKEKKSEEGIKRRQILTVIICFLLVGIVIAVGYYFSLTEEKTIPPMPYVSMRIELRSSFCTVINVTEAGHVWGWMIPLSDCAIKICPSKSSISSINWTRLLNLSSQAEELHAVFLDSSPYGIISADDRFILDPSIYGSGSKLIIAWISGGYQTLGSINID